MKNTVFLTGRSKTYSFSDMPFFMEGQSWLILGSSWPILALPGLILAHLRLLLGSAWPISTHLGSQEIHLDSSCTIRRGCGQIPWSRWLSRPAITLHSRSPPASRWLSRPAKTLHSKLLPDVSQSSVDDGRESKAAAPQTWIQKVNIKMNIKMNIKKKQTYVYIYMKSKYIN